MQTAKVDTVVHGGLVVTSTHAFEGSIAIKGETIAIVGPFEMMPPADNYIDVTGKYVLPGAIDAHCHFENSDVVNPDNWTTGPMAAAYAGVTTLVPFAHWNLATDKTLPQAIEHKLEEVAPQAVLDFGLHFFFPNDPAALEGLSDAIKESARMGVNSIKMMMAYKKRGRISRDDLIAKVMEEVADNGGILMLHCENGDVIDYLEEKALAEGRTHPRHFPSTAPAWSEEEAVNRAVLLGAMTGCTTYVVHLSTLGGLEDGSSRLKARASGCGRRRVRNTFFSTLMKRWIVGGPTSRSARRCVPRPKDIRRRCGVAQQRDTFPLSLLTILQSCLRTKNLVGRTSF